MTVGWRPAEWGAPTAVHAGCTLRGGGVSAAPYTSLNLGSHVGDEPAAVAENRRRVSEALALPRAPWWLQQVHGSAVLDADREGARGMGPRAADAAITRQAGTVLAILVADCLPVLLASADGAVLGAAHAGWRGLAGGVVAATVAAMAVDPGQLHAWLGPAIGRQHFEVGEEVRAQFLAHDERAADGFVRNPRGRWQCDLTWLAHRRLAQAGVHRVSGANLCTYADPAQCYSYRRDGSTGRMAALIWR